MLWRLVPRNPVFVGFAELRLAVISPFVDRRHGTERALSELLDRLAHRYHCEIHLYAQRVEDLILDDARPPRSADTGALVWHKVPAVPGPHLFRFFAWLVLNRLSRLWDSTWHGLRFALVFSPGINCLDADAILVHAVFHRLVELQPLSPRKGLRDLHRALYYRFLCALETRVYCRRQVLLAAVSQHTAAQLQNYFARQEIPVIPNGVDTSVFSPSARADHRAAARLRLQFAPHEQVLLLIGNDWHNKGLPALLEAAARCREFPLRLLVVGHEDPSSFSDSVARLQLTERVSFSRPAADVLDFYAAADIYVAPSREDSFNLPALEAMACGLPVLVSTRAGISECIHDRLDGVLLQNPEDPGELAAALRGLLEAPGIMQRLGENASQTAATLSWDRHAEAIYNLLAKHCSNPPGDS